MEEKLGSSAAAAEDAHAPMTVQYWRERQLSVVERAIGREWAALLSWW